MNSLVLSPQNTTKVIKVFGEDMENYKYSFTLKTNYTASHIRVFEMFDKKNYAFIPTHSGYLEIWRLEEDKAVWIQSFNGGSSTYGNAFYSNGYDLTSTFNILYFYNLIVYRSAPAKNSNGDFTGFSSKSKQTSISAGSQAVQSRGNLKYIRKTDEVYLVYESYNSSTAYDSAIILAIEKPDNEMTVRKQTLGELFQGFRYSVNSGVRPRGANWVGWNYPAQGVAYSENTGFLYIVSIYSLNKYNNLLPTLIAYDIENRKIAFTKSYDNTVFYNDSDYISVEASPHNSNILLASKKDMVAVNGKTGDVIKNTRFSSTAVLERVIEPYGESLFVNKTDSVQIWDIVNGSLKFVVTPKNSDGIPVPIRQYNFGFYNSSFRKLPVDRNSGEIILDESETIDDTPTITIKVGRKEKISQSFFILISESEILPTAKFEDAFLMKLASNIGSQHYKDIEWKFSTNYNETSKNGDWNPLNTGTGKLLNPTKNDGLICSNSVNRDSYIQVTLPQLERGKEYFIALMSYSE